MFILKNSKLYLSIATLLVCISLIFIFSFGLKKNIDFTGGVKILANYGESIDIQKSENTLNSIFKDVKIDSTINQFEYKITMQSLNENEYLKLKEVINQLGNKAPEVKEFSVIGPSISSEIVSKSIIGFILVVLAIILFITISFWSVGEKNSFHISSFKYSLVVIVTLLHDIIIPTGIFALLGYLYGVEIDALFVVALLTILGVSVSDTIVIFDRVRENVKVATKGESFSDVVDKSVNQSFIRSFMTSVSTLLVLIALVLFGPSSVFYFVLTLAIGVFVGTYSSLFVASPLLVWVEKNWPSKFEGK